MFSCRLIIVYVGFVLSFVLWNVLRWISFDGITLRVYMCGCYIYYTTIHILMMYEMLMPYNTPERRCACIGSVLDSNVGARLFFSHHFTVLKRKRIVHAAHITYKMHNID